METQTLKQFKTKQRLDIQELISKGRLINGLTGFESSLAIDRSVAMNENKRRKKRWLKHSKEIQTL